MSGGRDPYEPWDMTPRERDISTKYLKFINYHMHTALIETGPPLIPAGAPVMTRAVKRATNAVNMRASPCAAAQTPMGAEVPSRYTMLAVDIIRVGRRAFQFLFMP